MPAMADSPWGTEAARRGPRELLCSAVAPGRPLFPAWGSVCELGSDLQDVPALHGFYQARRSNALVHSVRAFPGFPPRIPWEGSGLGVPAMLNRRRVVCSASRIA